MDIHDDPYANLTPEEGEAYLQQQLAEVEEMFAGKPEPMLRGLSDEVTEEFRKLADSKDMIEHWYQSINPKVVGMDDVKRAVLLSIASHGDKFGDRGRLHVLMYGDPGTAKSMITDWLVFHQGAVGASMRTSRVGLTADASGEELVLGALSSGTTRSP
jgi:replicative DNA helicase Mcm